MSGKIYGNYPHGRTQIALIAAQYEGFNLEVVPTVPHSQDFVAKFPIGKIPAFESGDFKLTETLPIASYIAGLQNKANLLGSDLKSQALVAQWASWGNADFVPAISAWARPLSGAAPYTKAGVEAAKDSVRKQLTYLNTYLLDKTFLVGDRVSLGDIVVVVALHKGLTALFDPEYRAEFVNVIRYFNTVVHQPQFLAIFKEEPVFIDAPVVYTPPKKEKVEKAPKAETPKAAPAAAPAAEEAAPKPKHPAEALGPAKSFPLDEFKRQYSNNETPVAMKWLEEHLDPQEYSFVKVVYKYPTELTQTFMSANLVTGFHTRLEASRKYLFGSTGVYGTTNNSQIAGAYMFRGADWESIFNVGPDYESYEFTPLNFSDAKDREYIDGCWGWTNTFEGLEYTDGKVFK